MGHFHPFSTAVKKKKKKTLSKGTKLYQSAHTTPIFIFLVRCSSLRRSGLRYPSPPPTSPRRSRERWWTPSDRTRDSRTPSDVPHNLGVSKNRSSNIPEAIELAWTWMLELLEFREFTCTISMDLEWFLPPFLLDIPKISSTSSFRSLALPELPESLGWKAKMSNSINQRCGSARDLRKSWSDSPPARWGLLDFKIALRVPPPPSPSPPRLPASSPAPWSQWAELDLNCDLPISVGTGDLSSPVDTAGPQPRTSRAQWAPLDLKIDVQIECQIECQKECQMSSVFYRCLSVTSSI